jgi:hypothetical protein
LLYYTTAVATSILGNHNFYRNYSCKHSFSFPGCKITSQPFSHCDVNVYFPEVHFAKRGSCFVIFMCFSRFTIWWKFCELTIDISHEEINGNYYLWKYRGRTKKIIVFGMSTCKCL